MSNNGTLSQISTEDKVLTQFKIHNAPIVKPALEVMVQVSDDDFTVTATKCIHVSRDPLLRQRQINADTYQTINGTQILSSGLSRKILLKKLHKSYLFQG